MTFKAPHLAANSASQHGVSQSKVFDGMRNILKAAKEMYSPISWSTESFSSYNLH
jgi:hypothetical protein